MQYIIGTLGPKSWGRNTIAGLADVGMNIARINFSHAEYAETERIVRDIYEYNASHTNQLSVLLDTKGPEIRTLREQPFLVLQKGVPLLLSHTSLCGNNLPDGAVVCDYASLKDVQVGMSIMMDSGLCRCIVREQLPNGLLIEPLQTHTIGPRKHINIPEIVVRLPILNEKDEQDVLRGITHEVDILALSFVSCAEDVHKVRQFVVDHGGKQRIRSKIENRQAIYHREEIIRASDGVIVARGDLAIEIGYEKVPYYQEQIVALAKQFHTPVIIGTQCIESMQTCILPTRAEVNDIYHHVRMGVDGLLLANEIALGDHPELVISTVKQIVNFAQSV